MQKWRPDLYAEMWSMISDLMLELEIPMLKGRTRNQYAIEQDVSPWSNWMLIRSKSMIKYKKTTSVRIPNGDTAMDV